MTINRIYGQVNSRFREWAAPADLVTLIYIWITGIYILAGAGKMEYPFIHLATRVILSLLITWLVMRRGKKRSRTEIFLSAFYPILLLGFFYHETDYLNNILFPYMDPWFVALEQRLFGMQPSLAFSSGVPYRWFSELMYFGYFSYFLLIAGFLLWGYFRKNPRSGQNIFIVTVSFYIYYLVFCLFPVAGPQYYFPSPGSSTPDGYLFSCLIKGIQAMGERPTGAFPSSHVALATIILMMLFRQQRRMFFLALPVAVLLVFSTVYIKAHYLVDIAGGLLSAPLVFLLAKQIYLKLLIFGSSFEPAPSATTRYES